MEMPKSEFEIGDRVTADHVYIGTVISYSFECTAKGWSPGLVGIRYDHDEKVVYVRPNVLIKLPKITFQVGDEVITKYTGRRGKVDSIVDTGKAGEYVNVFMYDHGGITTYPPDKLRKVTEKEKAFEDCDKLEKIEKMLMEAMKIVRQMK